MTGAASGGSRTNLARVIENLRLAAKKGDRTALALALDEMRTLAYTPRYWLKYLTLLQHPLARIVDLLVIKQGDKIARQKGWTTPARKRTRTAKPAKLERPKPPRARSPGRGAAPDQPPLFPGL